MWVWYDIHQLISGFLIKGSEQNFLLSRYTNSACSIRWDNIELEFEGISSMKIKMSTVLSACSSRHIYLRKPYQDRKHLMWSNRNHAVCSGSRCLGQPQSLNRVKLLAKREIGIVKVNEEKDQMRRLEEYRRRFHTKYVLHPMSGLQSFLPSLVRIIRRRILRWKIFEYRLRQRFIWFTRKFSENRG